MKAVVIVSSASQHTRGGEVLIFHFLRRINYIIPQFLEGLNVYISIYEIHILTNNRRFRRMPEPDS